MVYTREEVFDYIEQEDVKFIRLAFCDIHGKQKNISILPAELPRAFSDGISFDASAIRGFGDEVQSDLFLRPIPSTLQLLSWRPSQGKVARMFCHIQYPDGTPYERDSRYILQTAIDKAREKGISIYFASEYEFYLFKTNDLGYPTKEPFDNASYMDVAPEDKGENIRREICLTLLDMGIRPESSHHEEGPGQNEIDFRYSDPMTSADNSMTFMTIVKVAAMRNGLYADFSPKPLEGKSGNGMHINMSVKNSKDEDLTISFMAGIMAHIKEMTLFLNPCEASYRRFGEKKAPKYITWSPENRSQLIRIPSAKGEYRRIELRSPDPMANPYIAYALLIHAGLDGIIHHLSLSEPVNLNLYTADKKIIDKLDRLPDSIEDALAIAKESKFIQSILPPNYVDQFMI